MHKQLEAFIDHVIRLTETCITSPNLLWYNALWAHHPQGWALGSCVCNLGSRPRCADSRHLRLALGTWNVTYVVGKEPELVQYKLDIVWLTSTHSTGTKHPERVDSLFLWSCPGWEAIGKCEDTLWRRSAVLDFSPENEGRIYITMSHWGGRLWLFCALMHRTADLSNQLSWSLLLTSWKWFHLGTRLVLLGDFSAHHARA